MRSEEEKKKYAGKILNLQKRASISNIIVFTDRIWHIP